MTNHHVPSYSDLFVGPVPNATDLISDIPSISLVFLITKFNFELYYDPNSQQVQNNILAHWLFYTDERFKTLVNAALYRFQKGLPNESGYSLFGRRYLLSYLNIVLENFNQLPQRRFTEEDLIKSFVAYLCVIERCHEEDQNSFNQSNETTDLGKLQEITWPFLMPQFEFNYKPNEAIELFKLFTLVSHIIQDSKLKTYFDAFLLQNQFPTAGHFIKSIDQISTLLEKNYSDFPFSERHSMIHATKALRLDNLSLDIETFKTEIKRNINYKLIREKPLLKVNPTDYILFDRAFFNAAISTGFLFELYYNTPLNIDPAYPKFDRFKSEISKSVFEEKLFRRIITKIFEAQSDILYFEQNENISIPDGFLKIGQDVFFFEFKDYLLRGEVYQSYDYAMIKQALDQKLAAEGKGVYQIKKQILNYIKGKFKFAPFSEEQIRIYPIIVHTNFMFSLPGVQQYLAHQLNSEISNDLPKNILLKELTLMNLDTFFWHYENFRTDNTALSKLIDAYFDNRLVDEALFEQNKTLDNYVNAYRSFDMEYEQNLVGTRLSHKNNFVHIIREISGVTQDILNYKPSDSK